MSICSRIKSALRKRGLIIKTVRPAEAARIGELVDLICQRNQDGSAFRYALRHWRSGERPIVERFSGHDTSLEVEGPCFMNDGRGYALGSQLFDGSRWFIIYPAETNDIANELRSAIDSVLRRWADQHPSAAYKFDPRRLRDRSHDDDTARHMVALQTWSDWPEEQGSNDR
ncbi:MULTISPECIES: hypothetical protein [unclassified Novosphingobium]|uniref:hypothetical protein n=1 Tax=unclassified Novosphingobium TaxID=2644732 RepID=UPI0025FDB5B2|nr:MULTISPECIES: hypothetical protein [unclassified Novosphingobium]HQV04706.1 hypothetical protein [Novosphingobium sp.]